MVLWVWQSGAPFDLLLNDYTNDPHHLPDVFNGWNATNQTGSLASGLGDDARSTSQVHSND